jgi:hypothetical protein
VQNLIYSGDVGQWMQFPASLKLTPALLIADVDLPTAKRKQKKPLQVTAAGT